MRNFFSNPTDSEALAIRLNISLAPSNNALGQPHFVRVDLETSQQSFPSNYEPLPYYTDAMVGLSAVKLYLHAHESVSSNGEALAPLLWQRLEPLQEIYNRSHDRIRPLLKKEITATALNDEFEKNFWTILKESCTQEGTQLSELIHLIDAINFFETKREKPLIFDSSLSLSAETLNALLTVYSLLYNLRGLMAYHYNSGRKDTIYGNLQIDSVKDYFHAAELLTNEALLYFHFQSLQRAGTLNGPSLESLGQAFRNFLPYSHFLVSALPSEFFIQQNHETLEQSLYAFQIDWLLGTPAGLLYRIREELIGLKEGYEQSFWPELQNEWNENPLENIEVNCLIDANQIRQVSSVA